MDCENNFKPLSLSDLNANLTVKSSYLSSYSFMLNFFQDKESITYDDFIVGSHMVYGWMPTILKNIGCEDKDKIVDLLNRAKKGKVPEEKEFTLLLESINNSLVGVSKLLHFINPKTFPIWDSVICKRLYGSENYKYKHVRNIENYLSYMNMIQNISKEKKFDVFWTKINNQIPEKVSAVRAIELAIFQDQKNS